MTKKFSNKQAVEMINKATEGMPAIQCSVPFLETTSNLVIQARHKDKTLNFLVDTGCNVSIFFSDYLNEVEYQTIETGANQEAASMYGDISLKDIIRVVLKIGYGFFNTTFMVKEGNSIGNAVSENIETPLHGILGLPFLQIGAGIINVYENSLTLHALHWNEEEVAAALAQMQQAAEQQEEQQTD